MIVLHQLTLTRPKNKRKVADCVLREPKALSKGIFLKTILSMKRARILIVTLFSKLSSPWAKRPYRVTSSKQRDVKVESNFIL